VAAGLKCSYPNMPLWIVAMLTSARCLPPFFLSLCFVSVPVLAADTASGVYPTVAFCQGPRPGDDAQRNQSIWDNECPAFLAEERAREKRRQELADQTAELNLQTAKNALAQAIQTTEGKENTGKDADIQTITNMQKLADALKKEPAALPELTAFDSTGKRYLADLAFHAGSEGAVALKGHLKHIGNPIDGKQHRILVISDPAIAATWTNIDEPTTVMNQLSQFIADADAIEKKACDQPASAAPGAPRFLGALLPATEALAVVNVIAQLAQAFTPIISNATAVTSPSTLTNAYLAGLQGNNVQRDSSDSQSNDAGVHAGDTNSNGGESARAKEINKKSASLDSWRFVLRPPVVGDNNAVMRRSADVKRAIAGTTDLVKIWTSLPTPSKETKECLKSVSYMLSELNNKIEDITSGSAPAGSSLDRAARYQAMRENYLDGILIIDFVVSGGSNTGYQRNRFSATKLIVGSDLAVVTQLYKADAEFVGGNYQSLGCGRAIPYGEFAEFYAGHCNWKPESSNTLVPKPHG
jgi:hypothetical protein